MNEGEKCSGSFDVLGARAAKTFFTSLSRARLSHGYLFTGPAGVGKKTFARRLAQSLLCERPASTLLGYDNSCRACILLRAGTHPDYFEARGTIKIGSDTPGVRREEQLTSRDLVRELSLRAYTGGYRILLLGDVAFATHEAANALLKFFEEPPEGVVVLLTTSALGTLLPTIRSRFIEIEFSALSKDEIIALLLREGVEQSAAERAAPVAQGSIARAREMLDTEEKGLRAAAIAWFSEAIQGRSYDLRLDERGATAAERRAFLSSFLEIVRMTARDWAVLSLVGEGAPLLAEDQRQHLSGLAAKRDAQRILAVLSTAAEAEKMASTNVTPALVADYLRMQLMSVGTL
jgi:DNA polymerase-3 subunit delta'